MNRKELLQKKHDESTTFVLAGCMMDVCLTIKEPEKVAESIGNAIKVLKADPTFIQRFQDKQRRILKELGH